MPLIFAGWLVLLGSVWLCALTGSWNAALVSMAGLLSLTVVAVSRPGETAPELRLRVRSLERVAREIARRGQIDELTGLLNREACERRLVEETERAVRYQQPVAVCFVDIDHFKAVNDTHGHRVGDRVLAAVAASLRSTVRTIDVVARYGGEEFVVIAPGTWSSDAVILADRLRDHVAGLQVFSSGEVLTISVGVAGLPEHASEPDALLQRADMALYAAKRAGRNRTRVPGGEEVTGRA